MWEPWMYPTVLLTVWSFIVPAYRKRNIYIAMWATSCSTLPVE
jgi:hypothetical protein